MKAEAVGTERTCEGDGNGPWKPGRDRASSATPAVRGLEPGREGWTGADRGQGLAAFLGWFSVGLGAMELLAPGRVGRMIGIDPGRTGRTVIRAMGAREIGAGLGILANPRSKEWVGARVGGDLLDFALLAAALTRSERPARTLAAAAAVLGATTLDLIGTETLARSRKAPTPEVADESALYLHKSITIAVPRSAVYAFWRDFTNLPRFMGHLRSVEVLDERRSRWVADGPRGTTVAWQAEITDEQENERIGWSSLDGSDVYHAGTVHFEDAPAERGTIVTVEMWYAPPGGTLGAAVLELMRREPAQQVLDDLRRLKQVLETGDVVVSDASRVRAPHPARPGGAGTGEEA